MKRIVHIMGLVVPLVLGLATLAAPIWAGEYILLESGSRLHAERHQVDGGSVRIFSNGGEIDVPTIAIKGYEPDEVVTPVVAPTAAPVASTAAAPAGQAPAAKPQTPGELAAHAAKKYRLPDSFVRSVMKTESGFNPEAVSPKGAIGLMQLMPDTARNLGVDPHDPGQNAEGGAEYLRELLARYENDPNQVLLALAAYNAGPAAVDRYHGVPPYRETREYILRVLKNWAPASAGGTVGTISDSATGSAGNVSAGNNANK